MLWLLIFFSEYSFTDFDDSRLILHSPSYKVHNIIITIVYFVHLHRIILFLKRIYVFFISSFFIYYHMNNINFLKKCFFLFLINKWIHWNLCPRAYNNYYDSIVLQVNNGADSILFLDKIICVIGSFILFIRKYIFVYRFF